MHSSNLSRPAKQGADHTHMGLPDDLAMDCAYYTLCAQHTSALPAPRPVRETCEGVPVRHSSLVPLCSLAFPQEGQ